MSVWPFLMALSLAVLSMAAVAGGRRYIVPAAAIFGAYIATRGLVASGVPLPHTSYAIAWISAAFFTIAHSLKNYEISLMLTGVAACYLWARAASAEAYFGSMPFVVSDLFAIAALLSIGSGARHDFIGRICDLASNSARCDFDCGAMRDSVGAEKARSAEKAGR